MRCAATAVRVALVACLCLMASGYANAQGYNPNGQTSNNNIPQKFGSTTCRTKIPCPDTTYLSASDLAANANACLAQGLGLGIISGYFDETAGLDSNGCMSIRSELLSKKDSKLIMPRCCVITLDDNSCTFHCDLTNGW